MTPKVITIRNLNGKEDGIMKTMKMFVTALVCFASVACVKENMDSENKNHELGTLAFNAVREDMSLPQVKSILDPNDKDDTDGRMMHWESGDAIIVFEADAPAASASNLPTEEDGTKWLQGYKFVTADSGSSATFTIKSDGNAADEGEFNADADKYIMLYVYSSNYYCNVAKSQARFYVSPSQEARKGSCHADRGSAIAKVSSLDERAEFKNLVSLLKFTVPETLSGKVASISVSGAANEHIAGDAFVDFSGDVPEVEVWHKKYGNTSAKYSAALIDSKGMASGDYYLAVIPTTVTEVNVKVTMTDGQILERSKTIEEGYEFKRSTIHYMGTIDENYARITATACEATSSTLAFTWTCGTSEEDDVARDYNLYLYDSDDNLVVSHTIKSDNITYTNGGLWVGRQPKFAFTGLNPNTDYYFVVEDTATQLKSNKVTGKTSDFQFVTVPEAEVGVGDVILAEDFAGLNGPETVNQAAGATKYSSLAALTGELVEPATKNDFTDANMAQYYKWDSDALGNITSNGINADWSDDSRLKNWGCYKNTAFGVYAHGGHLKIGTGSNTASLVTPRLTAIPQGKSATLKVEVTMARHKDHTGTLKMAVSSIEADFDGSKSIANTVKFKQSSAAIELTNKNVWQKYTFTISNVVTNDRLVIGPSEYTNGKSIYFVSDVVVTVTGLE